jgi:hypothetical protein
MPDFRHAVTELDPAVAQQRDLVPSAGPRRPDPQTVGTLIRPAAMLDLARRAGYADGQTLPVGHQVGRFYRLVP